jgi:hypothetical protein
MKLVLVHNIKRFIKIKFMPQPKLIDLESFASNLKKLGFAVNIDTSSDYISLEKNGKLEFIYLKSMEPQGTTGIEIIATLHIVDVDSVKYIALWHDNFPTRDCKKYQFDIQRLVDYCSEQF